MQRSEIRGCWHASKAIPDSAAARLHPGTDHPFHHAANGGYALLLEHVDAWRAAAPNEFDTLIDVINEAVRGRAKMRTPLWVLMPLPAEVLAGIES